MKRIKELKKEIGNAIRVGWFLAIRQILRGGKGTTALIIFIMVLTFLNLVVVSGLLVGLISGSFKQYRESYSGDVIITSAEGRDYIENSQQLVGFLKSHPNVVAISPRFGAGVTVLGTLTDLPDKDERANQIGIRMTGFDPVLEEHLTGFSRFIVDGEMLSGEQEGYALIGANMLKEFSSFADANIPGLDLLEDVRVGSRVKVSIASENGPVSKEFIIKGIVKSKVDELSTRMFVLDKELRRMIPINKDQFQEIAVVTTPGSAELVVRDTKRFMEGHAVRVQTSDEAIPSFLRDIETTMSILGNALSSFALVVAAITVFIVVFINAVTKQKFIGIMKGIGISPLAVQFSYVVQALFYGIVGSSIGLILTFGVLKPYFDANPIDFPFSDGILIATASGAGIRVAILLTVTFFAGFIPAWLIVRRNTLDSILGR